MGNHPSYNRESLLVNFWWRNSSVWQIHSRDGVSVDNRIFIMATVRSNLADDGINSLRCFSSTLVGFIVVTIRGIRPSWRLVLVLYCLFGRRETHLSERRGTHFNAILVGDEQQPMLSLRHTTGLFLVLGQRAVRNASAQHKMPHIEA